MTWLLFLLGNLSGILIGVAGLFVFIAYTRRWEQAFTPEEVERVAILLWRGYSQGNKSGGIWQDLQYNTKDAFRSAARAILADLNSKAAPEQPDQENTVYIEQTLQNIVGILRFQSRAIADIAAHLAAGSDQATIGGLTEKLKESAAALQTAIDAAQPPPTTTY